MFGKKKQFKESDTMIMNQPVSDEEYPPVISGDVVRQGLQNQQIQQQMQQPIQQMPQYQQQVQPMQQQMNQHQQFNQPKAEAMIIRAEISEGGDCIYVVKTNYPLSLGFCNLSQ